MTRILLVDDDPDQVETRRLLLEAKGYEVRGEQSAAGAASACAGFNPEAVVMDLALPRAEDGRRLIRRVRAWSKSVPIVVLTGLPSDLAGWPEGKLVSAVLSKPFRSVELLGLLSRLGARA